MLKEVSHINYGILLLTPTSIVHSTVLDLATPLSRIRIKTAKLLSSAVPGFMKLKGFVPPPDCGTAHANGDLIRVK